MARYPESAKPFLNDLLPPTGKPAPELASAEAETACRILLDMPDIGAWRKNATQILPRYRPTVDRLLKQDANSPDQEQMYRALRWRADLRLDPPAAPANTKLLTRSERPATSLQLPQDINSERPGCTRARELRRTDALERSGPHALHHAAALALGRSG